VIVVVILVFAGGGPPKKRQRRLERIDLDERQDDRTQRRGAFPAEPTYPNSRSTGAVEILSEVQQAGVLTSRPNTSLDEPLLLRDLALQLAEQRVPAQQSPPVGKSHKLAGAALLPENAGEYKKSC